MKLSREILRLAGPSILANITVPLVGMVDIAVVGHLGASGQYGAATLIGGISVGTMLFDLLYWNFGFLRTGTGGLTAQAYGRLRASTDESGRASEGDTVIGGILLRALRIAWISALVLIAIQWLVVQGAFLVVQCSPQVRALATQYFYIRIWAAPATLSLFAFKGWFIGLQDSVRPMTADLLVNGLNILLSVLLAFGLRLGPVQLLPVLGFPGVALGTVLAQWAGFTYALLAARRRYPGCVTLSGSTLCKYFSSPKSNEEYQQLAHTEQVTETSFLRLNVNLVLRSVGMIAVYIGFTVIGAGLGDMMLAVNTILMKLLMFFSYFTDGFAYAAEALTGRFIGARSPEGLRSTVRGCFAWSLALALVFMLLYGAGGTPILQVMTSDSAVVQAGKPFMGWLLLMPLIGCPAFVWDGVFIGATAGKDLRNSTLLCAVGFFAVWLLAAPHTSTPEEALHVLMCAYFAHLAIRAAYLSARYPALRKNLFL